MKKNFTEFSFEAIGTKWWIKIFDRTSAGSLSTLQSQIEFKVRTFENNYSRFLENSLISKLNKNRSLKNFPEELFLMFSKSEEMLKLSHGFFDVGIGQILEDLGYDQSYSFQLKKLQSPDSKIVKKAKYSNFEVLSADFIKLKEGVKIDLGGLGKGWIVDEVVNLIQNAKIKYFSVNGGGDIYSTGKQANEKGTFYLENPFANDEFIGEIQIQNQSIASSSGSKRNWTSQNQKFHHLINPETGNSVYDIAAVFTCGNNVLNADIGSTMLFVSPPNIHQEIAKNLKISHLIVFSDGYFYKSKDYPGLLN